MTERSKTERSKRVACLTMTRDEALFLPIWYRYYAGQFGPENVFIVDHKSGEAPPAEILGVRDLNLFRIPFDTPSTAPDRDQWAFDRERFKFVSNVITGLLKYYDTVIFNDTDEIFVPDPGIYPDLRTYIMGRRDGILAGVGLEIFHDPAEEPAFDPDRPVLSQRKNYVYRFHHSKPAILSVPCHIGGHGSRRPFRLDPDLYLLHLKFLDRGETLRRQAKLFAHFRQGRGGPASRWRLDVPAMERNLAQMAALPREEGFTHRPWLERALRRGRPEGGDPWKIGDTPVAQGFLQLTDFLPKDGLRAMQAVRRILPPRFADVRV